MTKLNVTGILAGAATFAAITIAASGSALAHGGGMGGNRGHSAVVAPTKAVTPTKIEKVVRIDRDRRRVRFGRFGFFDVAAAPVPACFYKWTSLGRVRICPDLGY
jgi:hypothetical protein